MALQTDRLSIVGLGIQDDSPPPGSSQPAPLANGVHLRWTTQRELGFPLNGFYVFRRPHTPASPACLSSDIGSEVAESLGTRTFAGNVGTVSSDADLVLTEAFPGATGRELDLDGRSYVHVEWQAAAQPAYGVDLTVGLREPVGVKAGQPICVDFENAPSGAGSNPRSMPAGASQVVTFQVYGANDTLLRSSEIRTWTNPKAGKTLICEERLRILLPCIANSVEVKTVGGDGQARVAVFDADGKRLTEKPAGKLVRTTKIACEGIAVVEIERGKEKKTRGLVSVCFTCPSTCVDFKTAPTGAGVNPRIVPVGAFQVATFQVFGANNTPLSSSEILAWPDPKAGKTLVCEQRLRVLLPCTANSVEVTTYGGSREATVAVFNAAGKRLTVKPAGKPGKKPVTAKIAYKGIAAVEIIAHKNETKPRGLIRVCFTCTPRPAIQVTAYSGTTPIASEVVTGMAGTTVPIKFRFDRITSVRLSSGPASLVELCFLPVVLAAPHEGWQALNPDPNPICLPVRDPAYPCNPQAPAPAISRALALRRVRYGASQPWTETFDKGLYPLLRELVVAGPPIAERRTAVPGVADPPDPGVRLPKMPARSPLDLVLLASLHPAIAQMVGLYWVDQTAVLGTAYDYLVVADHRPASAKPAKRGSAEMLAEIKANGFANVDGFIAFNLVRGVAAKLEPPQDVRAYVVPGTTIRKPGGDLKDATLAAALRWSRTTSPTGTFLSRDPLMFHVWRAGLGEAARPAVDGVYAALTTDAPVLIGDPPPGVTPSWPEDGPQFRLFYFDNGLAEGWYGYKVSGVDIFGRESEKSAPAKWYRWAPTAWLIEPAAVQLLDKSAPPIPTGVEAYALVPDDPWVQRDAAHTAWFAALSPGEQETLSGLRVRWKWTTDHMRQAPNTTEFRIYYNPGSTPPACAAEAVEWERRYYVVAYDQHVTVATDTDGRPIRKYEVLIPGPGDVDRPDLPLSPTLDNPVVYANVGVSAADDKQHTDDAPKWAGTYWGGRKGNEGRVGPAATIYRVLRTPPAAPVVPKSSARDYASPADYHSHSFYTYRWTPATALKTHVFRALDESIFAVDWDQRPRELMWNDASAFPSAAVETRWTEAKRKEVATNLNELNKVSGRETALAVYRQLGDDELRVLAGLPGNDAAFTQLTIQPLDPNEAANFDLRGPDSPETYVPDPNNLRAYVDTLGGRTTSRYFYRAAYVDGAHNLSALSLSGPPVYSPDVVPPQSPRPTRVTLGDGSATLYWASNRETDLKEYAVYRTANEDDARDLRGMTLVQTVALEVDNPASRPAEVSWEDTSLVGGSRYWFRLVAVDTVGNGSPPSAPIVVQAVDARPPEAPVWAEATWVLLKPDGTDEPFPAGAIPVDRTPAMRLMWDSALVGGGFTITRRARGEQLWRSVTVGSGYRMLDGTTYLLYDAGATPDLNYTYRIIATSAAGVRSLAPNELVVDRP